MVRPTFEEYPNRRDKREQLVTFVPQGPTTAIRPTT